MKLHTVVMCGVVGALLLASPRPAVSQDSSAASSLKVHVNYTGAGTVDEKHKVYVVLWDSPDFASGAESMPVAIKSVSSKDGSVTFDNVAKTPAYVSTVFDASGTWDAQSVPPDGSSLGLYSKTPGKPAPIELKSGGTTPVDVTFDDTEKMRGGKPSR